MLSEKEILERYSYYYEEIKKLGSFGLLERVKFNDLSLPKGIVRKAYKEMHDLDFKGTIIDYLCWVSANYILHIVRLENEYSEMQYGLAKNNEESYRLRIPKKIKPILRKHRVDAINFLRIINNCPVEAYKLIDSYGVEKEKIRNALLAFGASEIVGKNRVLLEDSDENELVREQLEDAWGVDEKRRKKKQSKSSKPK